MTTIFSAAPMRKTAEAEVERQGYTVLGSTPAGQLYSEDVSGDGWNVEVGLPEDE